MRSNKKTKHPKAKRSKQTQLRSNKKTKHPKAKRSEQTQIAQQSKNTNHPKAKRSEPPPIAQQSKNKASNPQFRSGSGLSVLDVRTNLRSQAASITLVTVAFMGNGKMLTFFKHFL
ncbi:hypothetical protein DNU06_09930 [Putridiphycobacter roseus]|uniref:Uncharacterized protein n=1 Tax=Putridiphycobacter roseus TaxID=2219161 RepID=A0A2W1NCG3_9FLAO|nr:hypothetical protein DNU06_09930 [Putridiphycobacter roseus]